MELQEKLKKVQELMKATNKTAKECMAIINAENPTKKVAKLNMSKAVKMTTKENNKLDAQISRENAKATCNPNELGELNKERAFKQWSKIL